MSFPSRAAGVGTPIESLPLVIRSKGVSSQYSRCAGVALLFKVHCGFVPPPPANRACNLLSIDFWRVALADEGVEVRPQMAAITLALRSAMSDRSDGVGLTGGTSGPDRSTIGDSREAEGETPSANSSKEVALSEPNKVIWFDIEDAPVVNDSIRDEPRIDELS